MVTFSQLINFKKKKSGSQTGQRLTPTRLIWKRAGGNKHIINKAQNRTYCMLAVFIPLQQKEQLLLKSTS